ncbi:MAG TPA: MFS transporter [Solirubrobacteraceae bacterium]|nr:MFS transporter [Solirubrobacteraceae bacterium]
MTDEQAPPRAPRRPMAELRIVAGSGTGRMIAVRGETVFGRDAGTADIVLDDDAGEISRRHARVTVTRAGTAVEDLGSTNGTFVNDARIDASRALVPGDRVRIGSTTLELVPPVDIEPPPSRRAAPASDGRARATIPAPAEVPVPPRAPGTDGELRIDSGPGSGRVAAVRGSATIGREPECDLQILDSEVSRRHAKVTVADGRAFLDDLNSANGTYVNGERILSRRELAPEDRIEIGQATISFSSPIFAGATPHAQPVQVSGVREVILGPGKLLGADSGSRKWWTLAVVCTTTFMLLLDMTIVAVALPSISGALHPSFSQLQWIVDAYSLMLAVALLTAGSIADIIGRRRVLVAGLLVFTASSIACGLAPSPTFLDFSRGVQGMGGAMMFACSLALIVQEFPAAERGVAFGVYGAVNGVSIAVGPIIGGLLTQGFGWESIFFVNIPIGVALLFVIGRKLVNLPGPPASIDWLGTVTFSGALFLLVFAVIRGNTDHWTSGRELACFAGSAVFLIAFGINEARRRQPMFDLGLFRIPTFNGTSIVAIALSGSLLATIFFMTTWLQSIQGFSPTGTGVRMLALSVLALMVAPFAGRMVGKIHPRLPMGVGLILVTSGLLLMHRVDMTSTWTVLLPGLILAGMGMGAINPTLGSTAVGIVPPWKGGMASGISSTCREFGTACGIAALGAILQHDVITHVKSVIGPTLIGAKASVIANAISVGGTPQVVAATPPGFRDLVSQTARGAYASGLSDLFLVAATLAGLGAIAAFTLVRRKDIINTEAGH